MYLWYVNLGTNFGVAMIVKYLRFDNLAQFS